MVDAAAAAKGSGAEQKDAVAAVEGRNNNNNNNNNNNDDDDEFDISIAAGSKISQPSDPPTVRLAGKEDWQDAGASATPMSLPPSVPDVSLGGADSLSVSQRSVVHPGTSRWTVHVDPATQQRYYHDVETGETTWTEPEVLIQARLAAGGGPSAGNSIVTESRSMHSAASFSLGQQGNWIKYIDEGSTLPYWYNIKTQKSTWTKPPLWKDDAPKEKSSAEKPTYAESAAAESASPSGAAAESAALSPDLSRKASASSMGSGGGTEEQQGNWIKYVDETSEVPYFFNVLTKKSMDAATWLAHENRLFVCEQLACSCAPSIARLKQLRWLRGTDS